MSVARLVDLRAFLDSCLACTLGKDVPKGGAHGQAVDAQTTGSVRGTTAQRKAGPGRTDNGAGAVTGAFDGGDCDRAREEDKAADKWIDLGYAVEGKAGSKQAVTKSSGDENQDPES